MNITVGMADMKTSSSPEDTIITYALGSCLGISIYDPQAGVGGLLHAMLPDSTIDPEKAAECPFMFVDTGIPRLFRACYQLGAEKQRIIVKVAGGATSKTQPQQDYFRIGERNFVALRKILWKNSVLVRSHDVGGCHSRTMSLEVETGEVFLKIDGATKKL